MDVVEPNDGEVSERFKELVLKTSDSERGRGFESHPLRHVRYRIDKPWRSTQAGSRGRFAKPLDRVTGAWVRIPSSPPHRGIAQLVEQWSPKPRAVGSSPTAPAKFELTA